jgi:hypothetical protein
MAEMYVYFDMDEPTYLQFNRAVNEGKIPRPRTGTETGPQYAASTFGILASPMRAALLATALQYPGRAGDIEVLIDVQGETHKGIFNFVDNVVNPGTGTISVRGIFKNPRPPGGSYLLVPGMFVRVRMPISQKHDSLLVIDRAVVPEQGKKTLYVLDENNKVVSRSVTLGPVQKNGLRVITHGITIKDRILIGGQQQVRPGMVLENVERVTMPTSIEAAVPLGVEKTKKK